LPERLWQIKKYWRSAGSRSGPEQAGEPKGGWAAAARASARRAAIDFITLSIGGEGNKL
jgi:hypothetical protein